MKEQKSWAKSIFAVTSFTEDLAAAKAFYQRVFELPVEYEDAVSVVFRFGEILINLLSISEAKELIEPEKVGSNVAGARHLFTIQVEDVDAKCAELKARGVEFSSGPINRPWGIRTANFKDPAGNIWEIAK